MKKLYLVACCVGAVIACGQYADAKNLNPQEALARFQKTSALKKAKSRLELKFTETYDGENSLYLFASPSGEGWVLLPADDSTLPVLGYSDDGRIPSDMSELPPAMKWWMESLSRQVAANVAADAAPQPQKVAGTAIEPMTKTTWNQDLPFNMYCPEADGRHCYTGCVATALAQVMKYHNYPPQGTGTHSYNWKNPKTEKDTTLSFDYDTSFDWDLMYDRYDKWSREDAKEAVGKLMYSCGVAVDMWYGLGGSGASTSNIGPAMIDYFGYDKGIRNYSRDYYGIDEWNQLVYDQLKDYGPVQYSGFADTDGHSFVIDGYSEDGYFHVNWGWGGMSDGYFLLTALDPINQGIGGAESAFDFSQDFVGNVKKEHTTAKIYEEFLMSNPFTIVEPTARPDEEIEIEGGVFSNSVGETGEIAFGICIESGSGSKTYVAGPVYEKLGIGEGTGPYRVRLPKDIPAGDYTVTPAYRNSDGEWVATPVKIGYRNSYTMVSDGTEVTFRSGATARITADDAVMPENVTLRKDFEVTANLVNDTDEEYFGSVCVALFDVKDSSILMVKGESVPVDVLPGETLEFRYESEFNPDDDSLKPGEYYIAICRKEGKKWMPVSELKKTNLIINGETGVATLDVDGDNIYYRLDGVRVTKPEKGTIVVNKNREKIIKNL